LCCVTLLPALAESSQPEITAHAAVVVDADTGKVLFEKNMDATLAPASLTKILTAIVALETVAPDARMTVDAYDLVGEASIGLFPGEELRFLTLLYGLMLASGNDAAMTIARNAGYLPGDSSQESVNRFIDRVNSTADRLGLRNTRIKNPHGLDQTGHYSSPRDIAAITMYALNNPVFRQIIAAPYYASEGREIYNVNRLLGAYPGLLGGKTGVTEQAGYCLVQVAQRDGRTVIAVVMGSNPQEWYRDAEALLDAGFAELASNPSDAERLRIGLATSQMTVPDVRADLGVGGALQVNRINEHEAEVRSSNGSGSSAVFSWRWPLISVGTMVALLAVMVNYPALLGLGTLALERVGRLRFPRLPAPGIGLPSDLLRFFQTRRRVRPRVDATGARTTFEHALIRSDTYPHEEGDMDRRTVSHGTTPAHSNAAQRYAERAIRLAQHANYHGAVDQFELALRSQPNLDLTRCPGFWRLQPMGYIAAAKAYLRLDRADDARALLTIVQISVSANPRLESLFRRAIRTIE
jgi:serine-type D-Ala-D-Ala carboxypeptidase (penicillin-binding protein 5/6)